MSSQDAIFYIFAIVAVIASFAVATSRNPLSGAIALLAALFAVAGLFAWSGAHFLAAMQVLVYAGAVAVLFVFVIMLLNLSDRELGSTTEAGGAQIAGLIFVVVALVGISAVALSATVSETRANVDPGAVKNVGEALLTRFIAPFEIISLLLLTSMAGAVMLVKRAHGATDAIDAINRIRARIDGVTTRAWSPDPTLPFQFGPPKKQEAPSVDTPETGVERGVLDPGETV